MDRIKTLHTVTLDFDKCKGCITCMRRCPTEAIRVRDGKASVDFDKCIACGECVRLCPHNAKKPAYDDVDVINNYKYKIAIPSPSLYGQFNNLSDVNYVLTGLLKIGFDDVMEVGKGAELASETTRILFDRKNDDYPVISTACPAVLELILVKYHNLKDNLLNLLAPVDITAKLARDRAIEKGIPPEDIGVFFISPCPAKVFALKCGIGVQKPYVDGVLANSDVYLKLLPVINKLSESEVKPLSKMSIIGLQWASSGGETAAAYRDKYLAADGIENVINILNSLEDGTLGEVEFIELGACTGGCVGGVMNIENPFVAKARIRELRTKFPGTRNHLADEGKSLEYYLWEREPTVKDVFKLHKDRATAMERLLKINELMEELPQIDCGLCGAPTCRAFCEDKVGGVISMDQKCPRLK